MERRLSLGHHLTCVSAFLPGAPDTLRGSRQGLRRGFAAILIAALLLPACGQNGIYSGTVITEGSHTMAGEELVLGELFVLGGTVRLAEGSWVGGSIYALGGNVTVAGEVDGDVQVLGGQVRLEPTAIVQGNVAVTGGTLDLAPAATVRGTVTTEVDEALQGPFGIGTQDPSLRDRLLWLAATTALFAVLAVIVVHFLARPVERIADASLLHGVVSGATGLLTLIVVPSLLVFMAFTIVLIPVALIGAALLGVTIAYGLIGTALGLGQWFARRRGWRWRPTVAVLAGAFALSAFLQGIALLSIVGAVFGLIVVAVALGAVLLTGYGLRPFVPRTEQPPNVSRES